MSAVTPRALLCATLLSFASLAGSAPALAQSTNAPIGVVVDQARLVKMPENVATIVVGNPLIADVALQPGGTMVVTGKGYGVTNLIAMDRSGKILEEQSIQVEGPTDKLVTVYRGIDRETYSCTPLCQRRVTLGDMPTYFNANLNQGGSLNDRAVGAGAMAGGARRP